MDIGHATEYINEFIFHFESIDNLQITKCTPINYDILLYYILYNDLEPHKIKIVYFLQRINHNFFPENIFRGSQLIILITV